VALHFLADEKQGIAGIVTRTRKGLPTYTPVPILGVNYTKCDNLFYNIDLQRVGTLTFLNGHAGHGNEYITASHVSFFFQNGFNIGNRLIR
jgi:hypothetical protein